MDRINQLQLTILQAIHANRRRASSPPPAAAAMPPVPMIHARVYIGAVPLDCYYEAPPTNTTTSPDSTSPASTTTERASPSSTNPTSIMSSSNSNASSFANPPSISSNPAFGGSLPSTSDSADKQSIFVVMQHSSSAGHSPLLPVSKVVSLHVNRECAMQALQALKVVKLSTIKPKIVDEVKRWWEEQIRFWCSGPTDGVGDYGFRYQSGEGGEEEFVLWIEEHELKD